MQAEFCIVGPSMFVEYNLTISCILLSFGDLLYDFFIFLQLKYKNLASIYYLEGFHQLFCHFNPKTNQVNPCALECFASHNLLGV